MRDYFDHFKYMFFDSGWRDLVTDVMPPPIVEYEFDMSPTTLGPIKQVLKVFPGYG